MTRRPPVRVMDYVIAALILFGTPAAVVVLMSVLGLIGKGCV